MTEENVTLKSLTEQVEFTDEGVTALVAKIDEVDNHKEKFVTGSVGKQPVYLSMWGHSSWKGQAPVGIGVAEEVDGKVVLKGKFFSTPDGQAAKTIVEEAGPLMEWSLGMIITKDKRVDGIREIHRVVLKEVSPVMKGAQHGTHTLSIKEDIDPVQEQTAALMADLDAYKSEHSGTVYPS